jgi:PAS domain S-box-containing protein
VSTGTTDPVALLKAEHAVAHILADADRLPDVAGDLLAAIGGALGWQLGVGWRVRDGELHVVDVWSDGSVGDGDMSAMCAIDRLDCGVGLPGRVWASGSPAWIVDVAEDANFPRRDAAITAGLRSAFCFPIVSAKMGFAGAVEFFTREELDPDDGLLSTMASLGRRMGTVIDRTLATRALRESDARGRATLDAALDAIVTMDESGRVVEWNPAAERTFGYTRDEAIGHDMAELIVPPRLRDQHRSGLVRYLTSGARTILDQRLEIDAIGKDRGEFPVELTITRIAVPGPPLFTGHIRDITDRKRADDELRASRARVVEAADAERRRIERDLHDGAQQRLVALALKLGIARSRIAKDPAAAERMIREALDELHSATAELRELARGIHPAVLSARGLHEALRALAGRSPVPVELVDDAAGERLPAPVEAAVYFVVAEALTNVARYAHATRAQVRIERVDRRVVAEVRDDGDGGADPAMGSGLRGLFDRVATLDGTLTLASPPGEGTAVHAEIPCA